MSFYDELKDFGQGALQGGKNMAELARLKMQVEELTKSNEDSYREIGRIYYSKYADCAEDEDLKKEIQAVSERMTQMEEYNRQIKALKGITQCSACGADVSVKAVFCKVCGARLIEEAVVAGNKCPNCGQPVEEDQIFCACCGTKLMTEPKTEENADESAASEAENAAPEVTAPEAESLEPEATAPEAESLEPEAESAEAEIVEPEAADSEEKDINIESISDALTDFEEAEKEAVSESNPEPQGDSVEVQRFCTQCGSDIEPGEKFCFNCGARLEGIFPQTELKDF